MSNRMIWQTLMLIMKPTVSCTHGEVDRHGGKAEIGADVQPGR